MSATDYVKNHIDELLAKHGYTTYLAFTEGRSDGTRRVYGVKADGNTIHTWGFLYMWMKETDVSFSEPIASQAFATISLGDPEFDNRLVKIVNDEYIKEKKRRIAWQDKIQFS